MSETDRPVVGLVVPDRATTIGGGARIWHKPGCPRRTAWGIATAMVCTCRDQPDAPQRAPRGADESRASAAPCAFCGDGGVAEGARWTFSVWRPIVGLNARRTNQGATRFAYADERRAWGWEIEVAKRNQQIPSATGKRRIEITRYLAAPPAAKRATGRGSPQLLDYGNLVGGCKPLLDALVLAKLLLDDSPRNLIDHYRQVISDYATDFDRVDVAITELAPTTEATR